MKSGQRGFALVVVVWLVALLALLAVSQSALQRTETLAAANLLLGAQARATAQAGIQLAILDLMRLPAQRQLHSDGQVHTQMVGNATLHLAVTDEAGKVDLNFATGPLLAALLMAAGMEDEQARTRLTDAILDWRDSDQLRRVYGAEQEEYQAAGISYSPRNGPFQSVEELALVLGMSAPLYHRLEPAITIYSGASSISSAVASGSLVAQLLELQDEAEAGVESDAPVASSRSVDTGRVYTIRSEAILPGNARAQLEVVVRLTSRRGSMPPLYDILLWRQVNEEPGEGSASAPV